jgi:excinuclease UvrABC ATPase subunit
LDEPTTGLHIEDVRKLLEVIQKLCKREYVGRIEHIWTSYNRRYNWVIVTWDLKEVKRRGK